MSETSSDSSTRNIVRRAWLDAVTLDELQDEIGSEEVEQMLISFEAEASRRVDTLLAADLNLGRAEVGRICHALKGMALSVGAFALGDAADALGQACSQAELNTLEALRKDLAFCGRGTGAAVRGWLAGDAPNG